MYAGNMNEFLCGIAYYSDLILSFSIQAITKIGKKLLDFEFPAKNNGYVMYFVGQRFKSKHIFMDQYIKLLPLICAVRVRFLDKEV